MYTSFLDKSDQNIVFFHLLTFIRRHHRTFAQVYAGWPSRLGVCTDFAEKQKKKNKQSIWQQNRIWINNMIYISFGARSWKTNILVRSKIHSVNWRKALHFPSFQTFSVRFLDLAVWQTSVTSVCCYMKPFRSPDSSEKWPLLEAATSTPVSGAAFVW